MCEMHYSLLLLLLLALTACSVTGFPSGPPVTPDANFDLVCNALAPSPSAHGNPSAGDGGYRLEISPPMAPATNGFTYSPNIVYTVRIGMGGTIQGFLVQARVPGDSPTLGQTPMLLGSFQTASGQQNLACDGAGVANQATIAHTQRQNAASVQFTWTAPSTAGDVDFFYTVVRQRFTHFDAISAQQAGVTFVTAPPPTTPGPTVATTMNTATTDMPETTEPPVTLPPGNPSLPVRAPDDYRLQVLSPDGCSRSSCDLFIGIDTNTRDSGFLDIYMEGTAAGWISVGFSATPNMFSADVVSCNRLGDSIMPIDGWNPASPTRASITDDIQDVVLHTASFNNSNTRIYCTVSKKITPSGSGQDLDLTNSLFVIFARRVSPSSRLNTLDSHAVDGTAVRGASANQFAIATDAGAAGQDMFDTVHRPNLIRAHGILMIIAWPLLAITAIFFALFMRPALPNGEWFQVHRAFLLASLLIGATAFVLIFVALKNSNGLVDVSSNVSLTHLILGVVVMALQIVNPIIAIFRCHPGTKHRWIFNLLHGSAVGFLAEILALVNVALGLSIFSRGLSQVQFRANLAPLWLFVSWDVFYVLLVLTLFVLFTIAAIYTKKKGLAPSAVQSLLPADQNEKKPEPSGINLDSAIGDKPPEKPAPQKKPLSKDAPIRWVALVVYLAVTVPALVAVIVMVALPE